MRAAWTVVVVAIVVVAACSASRSAGPSVPTVRAALDIIPSAAPTAAAGAPVTTDAGSPTAPPTTAGSPTPVKPGLSVAGNTLVDGSGRVVRLVGVNRFGAEYPCAQGWGIFDREADDAVAAAIASWGANSVRVLLNEHCWLGLPDVAPAYRGETYRKAIVEWVDRLNRHGLVVVLALAWSAPGDQPALSQAPMANADHSEAFWRSVASSFATRPYVLFDLYSEPHDIDWACWQKGCTRAGVRYVGMQALLDAVRTVDASRPVIVSGLNYSNDLSKWTELAPVDPSGQLVAGFHLYNFNRCASRSCWEHTAGAVARTVPVMLTEFGENTCGTAFTTSVLAWADAADVSFLAWAWAPWEACKGPSLVSDEAGTPTVYGSAVRDHIAALARASGEAPTSTTTP